MIQNIGNKAFILSTPKTAYAFALLPTGQLEHLYYGAPLQLGGPSGFIEEASAEGSRLLAALEPLREKHAFGPGTSVIYDQEHPQYSLDDMRLEFSAPGKGDLREPALELVNPDGSLSSDFVFESAKLLSEKLPFRSLPGSYFEDVKPVLADEESAESNDAPAGGRFAEAPEAEDRLAAAPSKEAIAAAAPEAESEAEKTDAQHLCISLQDAANSLKLELHYYVFEDCDVITRSARLENLGEEPVGIRRLMSLQLDLDRPGYVFTGFTGAWAREMQRTDTLLNAGRFSLESRSGASSHRANPFVMLHPRTTTEDSGEVYGFNLIYSGNHLETAEVSPFGKTRFLTGINPEGFGWMLQPGDDFEAPEAVMAWSGEGFNGLSQSMHRFVREHIVRGEWKHKDRPILLNSWEAAYFDISESKLLKLAKAGKDAGIELFVMDDGWFGTRNDDTQSLGDWDVNRKKLPGGLKGLADKINALGMDFGIWVEPEMVSVKSELYRAHPDWALEIPGKAHSEGRNQRILDLSNPQVREFIIEKMSEVFSSANIKYVKWDMNRPFSDYYSRYLANSKVCYAAQSELGHRYIMGLYEIMAELTARFPHILFEGCASGGNRFDLGILCYFPQIWASDDTDALARGFIQTGYSYGYPMSCVSAHVSARPNHQTLRNTPLETRFGVAAFGIFGYEMNFADLPSDAMNAIKVQIELYKKWRSVLQWGNFYRGRAFGSLPVSGVSENAAAGIPGAGNILEWTVVSPEKDKAVGLIFQNQVLPNWQFHSYFPKGLDPAAMYILYGRKRKFDLRNFGDLVNTVAPVHIKSESQIHHILSKFVKMDGETEDCISTGAALMNGGLHMKQAFGGTGYNEETRYFQDYACRMYFMERQ